MTQIIHIKAKTSRGFSDLFDFSSSNYQEQDFTLTVPGLLTRHKEELRFSSQAPLIGDFAKGGVSIDRVINQPCKEFEYFNQAKSLQDHKSVLGPETQNIFWLTFKDENGYLVNPDSLIDQDAEIYFLLNSRQMELSFEKSVPVTLRQDDIFKVGSISFRVLSLEGMNSEKKTKVEIENTLVRAVRYSYSRQNKDPSLANESLTQSKFRTEGISCRFCLGGTCVPENPLINPCSCTGSVEYVHIYCLQKWFRSKLQLSPEYSVVSVLWNNIRCELCKAAIPLSFSIDDKLFHLLDFEALGHDPAKSQKPVLVLEILNKEDKRPKGLYFVNFNKKNKFLMGRSKKCEIPLEDFSVSRTHATLKLKKDQVTLKDKYSKFGTQYLLRPPIKIRENKMFLQVGKTIFEIYGEKIPKKSSFLCWDYR